MCLRYGDFVQYTHLLAKSKAVHADDEIVKSHPVYDQRVA